MASNEHVGGREQWLHTWHWQHAVDTRAGRRLFTEVLAPDGIASGLAQVGLFMGDKNAPVVFLGAVPYEDVERSCGVTLFADDVFEKSLLEMGTADESEHTVAKMLENR